MPTTKHKVAEIEPDQDSGDDHRQFHVELLTLPWRGSWRADPADAYILVTRTVRVNGHVMKFERDPDPEKVDQGEATIATSGFELDAGVFMMIRLRRLTAESFAALEVTANDWMEDSTEELLILPVTSLTVKEAGEEPCSY